LTQTVQPPGLFPAAEAEDQSSELEVDVSGTTMTPLKDCGVYKCLGRLVEAHYLFKHVAAPKLKQALAEANNQCAHDEVVGVHVEVADNDIEMLLVGINDSILQIIELLLAKNPPATARNLQGHFDF
jgi:hypothetical protein